MNQLARGRLPYLLIFLACAGLLGYAYYAEFVLGLEPCPLCMLQRLGFMIMGATALVAGLHGPSSWGRWVYLLPFLGGAGWGFATAGRHVWLQNLPADQVPDCGPGLYFMREFDFPFSEIVREAFTGAGECAEIDWQFLGLTFPGWALVWYVALTVFMLWISFRRADAAGQAG
ncbi:MAG TPA: disulfide bond formation protein B [Wenzhouxiangella sp.]|nr:disulfide bond formation protein B [Wenzhouxiangella sp.]